MVYTPSTLRCDTPLREVAMLWLETDPMNERLTCVQDALSDRFTMVEVCARYGVSRKTGYKWIARYAEEGRRGLGDRSRAPHTCPHTLSATMTELLVTTREAHPFWGARKLLAVLQATHPRIRDWPAASTVADLLARRGLVQRRRTRRPTTHPGVIPAVADAPNDLWTADFKGQFRTGDHAYCYPLTVADLASRYLLLDRKFDWGRSSIRRDRRPRAHRQTGGGVPSASRARLAGRKNGGYRGGGDAGGDRSDAPRFVGARVDGGLRGPPCASRAARVRRCARIRSITETWVMNATTRMGPWQVGHASGSTSKICCKRAAHRRVASVGASRGAGTIRGGVSAAAGSA
jgi:transposase